MERMLDLPWQKCAVDRCLYLQGRAADMVVALGSGLSAARSLFRR